MWRTCWTRPGSPRVARPRRGGMRKPPRRSAPGPRKLGPGAADRDSEADVGHQDCTLAPAALRRPCGLCSELHGRATPVRRPRPRARHCEADVTPAFTGVTPRAAATRVQQPLAGGVEVEEREHEAALR